MTVVHIRHYIKPGDTSHPLFSVINGYLTGQYEFNIRLDAMVKKHSDLEDPRFLFYDCLYGIQVSEDFKNNAHDTQCMWEKGLLFLTPNDDNKEGAELRKEWESLKKPEVFYFLNNYSYDGPSNEFNKISNKREPYLYGSLEKGFVVSWPVTCDTYKRYIDYKKFGNHITEIEYL